MPFEIQLHFPCRYTVELGELPGSGRRQFHYPPTASSSPGGVAVLHVLPERGAAWVGVFSGGSQGGCHSCPDERSLAVVAGGTGYVVRSDQPELWEQVGAFPIVAVVPAPQARLLLMVNHTGIVAYGVEGVAWSNLSLASDEVKVLRVGQDVIEGTAWTGRQRKFVLDITTGRVIEGGGGS